MRVLYYVIYAGQIGTNTESQKQNVSEGLERIMGSLFKKHSIDQTRVVYCDHPNDMEELVNTLDDLQIPCANTFDENACVFTAATFIITSDNSPVYELVAKIDSRISTR